MEGCIKKDEQPLVVFKSQRVVLPDGVAPASIVTKNGKIISIASYHADRKDLGVVDELLCVNTHDFGNLVLMAGIVDSHVHINEPGRTHWEGFVTATKAAAAGGVTTVVDMPLNSIPPTTTVENLEEKMKAATGHVTIDVAFWGGIIPGNQDKLVPLLDAGVRGFKCFLCPSGVDEFPMVSQQDLETAYIQLQNTAATILFHAEVDCCPTSTQSSATPIVYNTFLESRPGIMETEAIRMVIKLCQRYRVPSHIVHLSCADAIPLIEEAKKNGVPITVETCPHYLTLAAGDVPMKATQFKCCPPVREQCNQDQLWKGVLDGVIDMVVSDHSPAPQDLKCVDTGDFMKAWGGISSLQLALPLIWTHGSPKGLSLEDVTRLLSHNTAKLARLQHHKGSIAIGLDADFVVWNPDGDVLVTREMLQFRHKLSPYLGQILKGDVIRTILRGDVVYSNGQLVSEPIGRLLNST